MTHWLGKCSNTNSNASANALRHFESFAQYPLRHSHMHSPASLYTTKSFSWQVPFPLKKEVGRPMVGRHDAHTITSKSNFGGGINRRKTLEDLVNDALFRTEYCMLFCTTVQNDGVFYAANKTNQPQHQFTRISEQNAEKKWQVNIIQREYNNNNNSNKYQ